MNRKFTLGFICTFIAGELPPPFKRPIVTPFGLREAEPQHKPQHHPCHEQRVDQGDFRYEDDDARRPTVLRNPYGVFAPWRPRASGFLCVPLPWPRSSSRLVSRNISPPCKGSASLPGNASASASLSWRSAGCSIKASRRRCGARVIPIRLQPVDEVTG